MLHLYVESKRKSKPFETGSRKVVAGAGGGGNEKRLLKWYKLSVKRWVSSEDAVYSMVTIVDNSELYNWFC